MKGIHLAGVLAALTVVSAERLSCVQCNSLDNSCANQNAIECPLNASVSCSSFLINSSLGKVFQDKACSANNCSDGLVDFEVHVSDEERFHFESECCQGDTCKNASDASPQKDEYSMECPVCYSDAEMSCVVKYRKCQPGERCVNLVAEFDEMKQLVLKGCSNINNSTCQLLSSGNQMIGKVRFKTFECIDNNNATSMPITTTATLTTTPSTESSTASSTESNTVPSTASSTESSTASSTESNTLPSTASSTESNTLPSTASSTESSTESSTKSSAASSTASKVSFAPAGLASLLLLGLLL